MNKDYSKFLSTKLYLIEAIALKEMLKGNEQMREIYNICLASHIKIQNMMEEKCRR